MTIKNTSSFDHLKKLIQDKSGQAVVELAIMFPIILIIAVICINALTFFSECSYFDRTLKQIVSCTATSPAYGCSSDNVVASVKNQLQDKMNKDFLDFEVWAEAKAGGFYQYNGVIKMYPTLFGLGLKKEIFGISLPSLNHEQRIIIEQYKPGVIF